MVQHHIASPYNNIISLCQSPDVDLVSVVSPAYLHAEQMIGARRMTLSVPRLAASNMACSES
jgi:hypothetical protein